MGRRPRDGTARLVDDSLARALGGTVMARLNIRAILADPTLRQQLLDLSVDFICKIEGIRGREPRSLLFNERDGRPSPQYFTDLERFGF
jgi:hypothetical protein